MANVPQRRLNKEKKIKADQKREEEFIKYGSDPYYTEDDIREIERQVKLDKLGIPITEYKEAKQDSQSGKYGTMKKGGAVKKKSVSSASKRGDGIAIKGKTKGRFV